MPLLYGETRGLSIPVPDKLWIRVAGACVGQTGYNKTMRHFLPMRYCIPNADDESEAPHNYDYALDLDKMEPGLTRGEYAAAIVSNMCKKRSVKQYGQKMAVLPELSWTTLVAHVQAYGRANAWKEDDAEKSVETMLTMEPRFGMEHWRVDLVEWPFPGDRCFLAWSNAVINGHMLRKVKTSMQRREEPTNGNTCTQLGRWFAQRPDLLSLAPPLIKVLVERVQKLDTMGPNALDTGLLNGNAYAAHTYRNRLLSDTLGHPENTAWDEQAFRFFVMGFAWELRAQGNPTIFERVYLSVNGSQSYKSPAQLSLCMADDSWVSQKLNDAVEVSKLSLVTLAEKSKDCGLDAFYPSNLMFMDKRAQFKTVVLAAGRRPEWAQAMYKLTLVESLRAHFGPSSGYDQLSQERLEESSSLLAAMEKDDRNALFVEMALSISIIAKALARDYKSVDPWGSYAETMFDAWAMPRQEEEVEGKTAMAVFTAWLQLWDHPHQKDIDVLSMIAGDVPTIGHWLEEKFRNSQGNEMEEEALPMDLFDLPTGL